MKTEDFNRRLEFLQSCTLLSHVSLFTLIPIANNLKLRRFKMGEIILKAGSKP
jgi:hypothetical protein